MQRFKVGDPVDQGNVVTICYDFSGGATSPVDVTLSWTPEGMFPEEDLVLSEEEPCQTRQVPGAAEGGLLVDASGQSEDRTITVTVP